MRHHRFTVKFGRQRSHYKATLKHLVSGLIINKTITTTKTKAKQASRLIEKLITAARDKTVANQRKAYRILGDRKIVSILFNEIAPLFKDRNGGYTSVMLTNKRRGDNAQMAILEFVEKPKPKEEMPKKKEKKRKVVVQPEEKTMVEKIEEPKKVKPEKEEIAKKEEVKEPVRPPKEVERPKEPKQKPGFFKKFFGKRRTRE
jgi:large subunit ribosomal protein L17